MLFPFVRLSTLEETQERWYFEVQQLKNSLRVADDLRDEALLQAQKSDEQRARLETAHKNACEEIASRDYEIRQLQFTIDEVRSRMPQLVKEVEDLKPIVAEIATLRDEIAELEHDLDEAAVERQALQNERNRYSKQLAAIKVALAAGLKAKRPNWKQIVAEFL